MCLPVSVLLGDGRFQRVCIFKVVPEVTQSSVREAKDDVLVEAEKQHGLDALKGLAGKEASDPVAVGVKELRGEACCGVDAVVPRGHKRHDGDGGGGGGDLADDAAVAAVGALTAAVGALEALCPPQQAVDALHCQLRHDPVGLQLSPLALLHRGCRHLPCMFQGGGWVGEGGSSDPTNRLPKWKGGREGGHLQPKVAAPGLSAAAPPLAEELHYQQHYQAKMAIRNRAAAAEGPVGKREGHGGRGDG